MTITGNQTPCGHIRLQKIDTDAHTRTHINTGSYDIDTDTEQTGTPLICLLYKESIRPRLPLSLPLSLGRAKILND